MIFEKKNSGVGGGWGGGVGVVGWWGGGGGGGGGWGWGVGWGARCDQVCFYFNKHDLYKWNRYQMTWYCTWIHTPVYTWWRHQMETFPRYRPFVRGIHRSPVNSLHKGQWRGALMFSLICAWINGWVNNGEAGHCNEDRQVREGSRYRIW